MVNNIPVFSREIPSLGVFELRPFSVEKNIEFLHDWVNRPYAQYWGLQNTTIEKVRVTYEELLEIPDYEIYVGFCEDKPIFLTECYAPEFDIMGKYYEVEKGDKGMHVLVGPPEKKLSGFTWAVFTTIMDFLFTNEAVQRVVVEPDVRNEKIHLLNKRAGFVYQKIIEFPHKTAHLAFCTRVQYKLAMRQENKTEQQ